MKNINWTAALIENGIYILIVSFLGLFVAWSLFDVPLNQWSMLGALLIPLIVVLTDNCY